MNYLVEDSTGKLSLADVKNIADTAAFKSDCEAKNLTIKGWVLPLQTVTFDNAAKTVVVSIESLAHHIQQVA